MSTELILSVQGMTCGSCKAKVGGALDGVDGVESYDVDLVNRLVTVRGDAVDDGRVLGALAAAGYPAQTEQA